MRRSVLKKNLKKIEKIATFDDASIVIQVWTQRTEPRTKQSDIHSKSEEVVNALKAIVTIESTNNIAQTLNLNAHQSLTFEMKVVDVMNNCE